MRLGPDSQRMRALTRTIVAVPALLLFAGCTGTTPDPGPAPTGDPTVEPSGEPAEDPTATEEPTTPEPEPPTAADVQDWAENTEWRWSDDGIQAPINLSFQNGESEDPDGRTYTIGAGVEGDANGDGIVDLAIPATQTNGDESQELWYVWLGRAGGGSPAEQVIYPIARTQNCGDITNALTAIDAGYQIDHTLKMPWVDDDRGCEEGGTGEQIREITIAEIDGAWYPVQTAPATAWGGICPMSEILDGDFLPEGEGRVAPPASAERVQPEGAVVSEFELEDSPLMTADGVDFFGFVPGQGEPDAVANLGNVYQQCAFFDRVEARTESP